MRLNKSKGLKEKDVLWAIELSNTQFCSAAIVQGKTADVTWTFEIENEE